VVTQLDDPEWLWAIAADDVDPDLGPLHVSRLAADGGWRDHEPPREANTLCASGIVGQMVERLADELLRVVDEAASQLRTVGEAVAAAKLRPEVWSIKEIVGHLIDSAANNHQRFVRAQQTDELAFPGYEQDTWVRLQGYQDRPWLELIDFWAQYNHQLSHAIRRIPETALRVTCRIDNESVTLRFLVEDYLVHLRHHLKQIEERRAA
jgi:hypothetical protein